MTDVLQKKIFTEEARKEIDEKKIRPATYFWDTMDTTLGEYKDLSIFKTWVSVREIPLYSTDDAFTFLYSEENEEMLQYSPYQKEWLEVVKLGESKKGHTKESYQVAMDYTFRDMPTSLWIMKALHHLLSFEGMMGKSILDYDHIIEFGAGIGETARMIFNRGFTGSYSIIDLPNVARISKYYLDDKKVDYIEVKDIINRPKTLFIALWSLSEIPFEARYDLAEKIEGMDHLILFSNEILGMNNREFFLYFWQPLTKTWSRLQKMAFHHSDGGNNYLVGKAF